jgi:asparagine synthase (glutamine-hydrolysing)
MFAIAIYDKKKKAIFLARDQIGIKPLYYAFKNGTFCFASEIKPIKEFFPSINFDKQSIYYFFSRQAGCSKNSVYEDIFKLQPGTFLRFDLRKKILTQKIFWVPQIGNFDNKNHFLEEELYNIFKASVKRWCSSDTPIAISLSGGLDSSAILSTMSDIGFKNIKTYSLIYPKNKYLDESANLKQLVNKFETNHKEIIYNDIDIKKELNNMFLALGEPYAGGIPSWFIYKEMSKDVKVCLTGTGGDELFGNYGKSSVYLNNLLGIKRHMGNFWREKSFGNFRSYSGASKYHPNIFNEHIKSNKLFNKEWLCSFEPEITENFLNNNTYRNVGDFITEYDLTTQLPEEFLYVTDRFSMAHSLEVRTPFLDIEFVEKVLSLKNSQRFSVQDPKFLLKKMFKKSLPKEVIEGKKKGFTIDLTKLMKFEIHDELSFLFSRDNLKKSHIFNVNYVNNIFKKFQDGDKNKVDKIWTIYCFLKWLDLNT